MRCKRSFCARYFRMLRLPATNCGAQRTRIAANHFVLIRSFLIESDVFRRLRATICAKFFITPAYALRASSTQNVAINMCKFFFKNARRAGYRHYKNPYFTVFFCNHDDARTNLFARRACAPMMTTVVTQMRRRVSQLVRVHVSLSGNAVFFAVL